MKDILRVAGRIGSAGACRLEIPRVCIRFPNESADSQGHHYSPYPNVPVFIETLLSLGVLPGVY